jgi:hypothetical protein
MNLARRETLITSLKSKFPGVFFKNSEDFDGNVSGIWTGLGEDCIDGKLHFDYYRVESESEELAAWLKANECFAEPYDPGTIFIWDA